MAYDPDFIPGHTVALPDLGTRAREQAFNSGTPVNHTRFSLVFNAVRGFATFTAHNIDGANAIPPGTFSRRDSFRLDPGVTRDLQVDDDRGYNGGARNPWDRGHLVRRAALHWGDIDEAKQADKDSFYWTNIAPQHENLHDKPWGSIEDWMFQRADDADKRACVFTGPVYSEDDPELINKPGERAIRIPAGFWKIFVLSTAGALKSATFLVWQRDFDREDPLTFNPVLEQVRLTTVEYLTGLSFANIRDADPLLYRRGGRLRILAEMFEPETQLRSTAIKGPNDIIL